ncbi:Crp/Fnr family transcriptional regulator [Ammoniphilus oxalaticus]|uniref:Crp/Fnr family transcriptional regulator n=1 Tax=Ammoniphilus oxalaticus TaxID=66863 RepID=A0A419SKZ2_9BACL|nr:Crp/Fnr family transcriptional regulator [Ammoniphilus oxalaticus]RKD24619.1 Crp/Fnr family transcriptional regulator [Ammoniphilus oxalaticus]
MNPCNHHSVSIKEMQKLCVSLVPIFNHLQPTEMEKIVHATRSASYQRGEQIYGAGDTSAQLFIVHRGLVKIFRLSESGREQLIRLLEPGDFMGELALFSGSPFDHFAVAMEQTELCVMTREDLNAFIEQHPKISLRIMEEFSRRLERAEKLISCLTSEATEQRIAAYLVELADEHAANSFTLPMSKKDIASYLGTTPETVSRKLAEFQENGWIEQSGQRNITLLDRYALQNL